MSYGDNYEYDDVTMSAMENAIRDFFKHGDIDIMEFYKNNDSLNVKGKIDGHIIVTLKQRHDINLQIKRTDKHKDSFSITGSALRYYLTHDLDIQGLLIGLAYNKEMYLFRWDEFIDLAQEYYTQWKSPYGDYYVIVIYELINKLHHQLLPYTKKDYKKLTKLWDEI